LAEYKIPLKNTPEEFIISLDGKDLLITTKWNELSGWVIDIADSATNTRILSSVPLVTGVDLLSPFVDLGFVGALVVYTDGDPMAIPTLDNLGADCNLYFVTA